MSSLTDRSLAIYVLTLNEIVTTSYIEDLMDDLKRVEKDWKTSACGLFLAGSYALLQQDSKAISILNGIKKEFKNELNSRIKYMKEINSDFKSFFSKVQKQFYGLKHGWIFRYG